MTGEALGLVEVRGYLGAVIAADAALKAANVSLLNIEPVKAGLHTVQLVGDVSAVKAAVDAAVSVVGSESYYLGSHVIPRLDEQTEVLFTRKQSKQPSKVDQSTPSDEKKVVEQQTTYTMEELEKLKVVELRSIAYRQADIGLTKKRD